MEEAPLAQAMVRGIHSLISLENITTSPSSVHAIVSRGLPKVGKHNPSNLDYIMNYILHESCEEYWNTFHDLICNKNMLPKISSIIRELGVASFLPESTKVANKLASKYLGLN